MTRSEAFKMCLDTIKKKATKGVWASLVHRFNAGKLKEQTIKKLLNENGFVKVRDEDWVNSNEVSHEVKQGLEVIMGAEMSEDVRQKIEDAINSSLLEDETEYITLATFDPDERQFSLRTIKADSVYEAKKKNGGKGEDVSGGLHELCSYVNEVISNYYG